MSPLLWLIVIGVPVVVGAVVLESVVAKRKKMKLYTLSDSVTNVSCGILERITDFFLAVLILFGFNWLYENVAPYHIPMNPLTWFLAILIYDFLAYWFHRYSHEINFLWAAHIVHHQSEELNLTTVFRASVFAVFFRAFFFVWMALMGFDVATIVICTMFLGLYQLFTHSRIIGKLGFLEYFLTTPSHHRVHHGRNEKYMDHNYSHIFIIWDRMFGTFVEESEEPEYGITTGFESANAYYATFSYWKNLFTRASRAKKMTDKIKVFTKGPEWTPEDVAHLPNEYKIDEGGQRIHHRIPVNFELGAYVLFNLAITFSAFLSLMLLKGQLVGESLETSDLYTLLFNPKVLALVGIILISLFAHARMIEQTKASVYIDAFRLVFISGLTFFVFNNQPFAEWLVPSVLGVCGLMLLWLLRLSTKKKSEQAKVATT